LVLPPGSDAVVRIDPASADEIDVLDAGGNLVRHDLASGRGMRLAAPPSPLPRAAEDVATLPGGAVVLADFDQLVRFGGEGTPWSRPTSRCERVVCLGGVVVAASGTHLGWLDPETGEMLAERDAEVASSWVEVLRVIDDDRLLVAGYDDARLQIWSARERRRVGERLLDHRHDDGRFARPYGLHVHRTDAAIRVLVSYWDDTLDVLRVEGDGLVLERTLALHDGYPFIGLDADASTLLLGREDMVVALSYPSCAPRWRWSTSRKLSAMAVLADGRVVDGSNDGALTVLRGPASHD
jgi:hypothetical protein